MDNSNQKPETAENLRMEYSAVVNYHGDLVKSRFTIAGFFVAAIGFLASVVFKDETTPAVQVICSLFGCWITLCVWILELRSRALYNRVAHRGIDIEHHCWGLMEDKWYEGFFSRQYKEEPKSNADTKSIPPKPTYDCPKLGWSKKPMSESLSKYISHSLGFDLLYAGSGLFWLISFAYLLIDNYFC